MFFANLGGDPARTEDFAQERRFQNRDDGFDANGLTIRSGPVSSDFARRLMISSVPEMKAKKVTADDRRLGHASAPKTTSREWSDRL